MKFKPSISRAGLSFGLALASVSTLTALIGSILVLRAMEGENRAYVQQAIGDTTVILATHFQTEFEHYVGRLLETGDKQLRPMIASFQLQGVPGVPTPIVGTVDTDTEISDIAIWKRGKPSTVFDLNPDPVRSFLAVNSQHTNYSADYVRQLDLAGLEEKHLILPSFQGHIVVTLPPQSAGLKSEAMLVVPFGLGVVDEVLVAHIRLEKFQKAFSRAGMVFAVMVDDFGNILAHPDPKWIGKREGVSNTPLFQAMRNSQLPNGQLTYQDATGNQYFGGYVRLGLGRVSVLASLSEQEATAAIRVMRKQSVIYVLAGFFFFLGAGYLIYSRISIGSVENLREISPYESQPAKKIVVTILHGSLRHVNQMVEELPPEDIADALNDYFTVAASAVKEFGGVFERHASASFIGIWGVPEEDGTEIWRSLRCALELRQNFFHLNESRKVDGHKALVISMGIHTGNGLAARVGSAGQMKYTVIGEVLSCAKSLSRLTLSVGVDFLVSHDTWHHSEAKFEGEPMGEAKLTPVTGLTPFYSLSGYRDEQGQLVPVEIHKELFQNSKESGSESTASALISQEKKAVRWLVNNGSQIVGPLTSSEIASRLFAQELDFDCECWAEGTGTSAQIKNAGIFTGSEDDNANLWLFDGEIVHGPMNIGFLKTAMGHGAIQESVYVCIESTVQGWKPFAEWSEHLFVENKKAVSTPPVDGALRASLAPPVALVKEQQGPDLEIPVEKDLQKKAA